MVIFSYNLEGESLYNFFSLLQITVGTSKGLHHSYTDKEWCEVMKMAEQQSLLGICFAGIEKLSKDQLPDKVTLLEWIGQAEYIKSQNFLLNNQCSEVEQILSKNKLPSCILKGQGLGALYGDLAPYRAPGDIDLWVNGSCDQVMEYVNAISPNREFDGKHTHLNVFPDTSVEVHWWPSVTTNPIISRNLKSFYRAQVSTQCNHKIILYSGQTITATDAFFDSIHVLINIFGHFLYEGVRLKQVTDYYFDCIHEDVQKRKEEIVAYYKDFGLYDFSRSVMWVLQEVFGMDDKYLLVEPNVKGGRELLREIMEQGDSGLALAGSQVIKESTLCRWFHRAKRKLRLIKYYPLGVLYSPIYKLQLLLWKRKVINKYNL